MNSINSIALFLSTLMFLGNVSAQDDFYPSSKKRTDNTISPVNGSVEKTISDDEYSTATDYYIDSQKKEKEAAYNAQMGITDSTTYYEDENGELRVTNNYFNGDNYDFENEYYDYEYSSRIKRFRQKQGRYGYYDDYYTNYYWYDYDPFYYGTSIYTSYGWWNPSPWHWNVGWSYYNGWTLGWSWGWGWTGNYGYCGNGYYGWNGYYGNYYNHGCYDGFCGSSYYYNSYDHNSHYYGKRGGSSSSSGYGTREPNSSVASNNNISTKTFGQKYEAAVKQNTLNTNVTTLNSSPKNNFNNNNTANPKISTNGTKGDMLYPNGQPKNPNVEGNSGMYANPRTSSKSTTNNNSGNIYQKPTYTKPNNSTTQPNYNKPRNDYNNSKSTYTKPSNNQQRDSKPSYNKPSNTQPSYSKPSGNYNRSGGSSGSKSSSGGSRRR